ncbi:MAG: RNA 2',3'-cyclic phosphodiesterase [Steroidobacter sp.]
MPSGSAKDSQRLFFALWPSDEFRDQLVSETQAIARDSGGRVIPPENLHVTLFFLGQVSLSRLEFVQQAGAGCANAPGFQLNFDRTEIWGRANLLCLTTSTVPADVTTLAEKLRDSLRGEALGGSEHEFRPHITLARDLPRHGRPAPIKTLRMKVNDLVLVESRPGSVGSHYSVMARWPLLSSAATITNPTVAESD